MEKIGNTPLIPFYKKVISVLAIYLKDKPDKEESKLKNVEKADEPDDTCTTGKPKEIVASTKDKLPGKKKRKSSIEKSLDIVFDKMKQTADTDFER